MTGRKISVWIQLGKQRAQVFHLMERSIWWGRVAIGATGIENEHGDQRLKSLTIFSHAKVGAMHRACRRAQPRAAAVLERFTGFKHRLLADHTQSFDFFYMTIGIDNFPVA